MPTINVSLPDDLNEFVVEQLRHGGYRDQSEVVLDALRLLRSRQQTSLRLRADIEANASDVVAAGTHPLTAQLLVDIERRVSAHRLLAETSQAMPSAAGNKGMDTLFERYSRPMGGESFSRDDLHYRGD